MHVLRKQGVLLGSGSGSCCYEGNGVLVNFADFVRNDECWPLENVLLLLSLIVSACVYVYVFVTVYVLYQDFSFGVYFACVGVYFRWCKE